MEKQHSKRNSPAARFHALLVLLSRTLIKVLGLVSDKDAFRLDLVLVSDWRDCEFYSTKLKLEKQWAKVRC